MKLLRAVAILIFVIGLAVSILGLLLLTSLEGNMQLMEDMQRQGMAQNIDIPTFRWIIVKAAVQYVVVGLLSVISSIGIFFRKSWGRWFWLTILVFITLMGTYTVVLQVLRGTIETRDVIGISVIGLFIALMFGYFNREKTKSLFRRTREEKTIPLQS